jgi:di- and tripeptidase
MASIFGARSSVRQQARNTIGTNSNLAEVSSIPTDDDSTHEQDERNGNVERTRSGENLPELLHRVQHDSSILAVAVSAQYIYAGTQEGEILAWSLDSYELALRIQAHKRAVLCLFLSQDGRLLFSSAGDAIVNAWCPKNLKRLYHIYSTYDVGDVFSVAYSTQFQTAYFGAQNTSIQWCSLKDSASRPTPSEERHPDRRNHRFFDSAAGGRLTPRPVPDPVASTMSNAGETLEVDKAHMKHYAHFGYVYCMLIARGASRLVELDEDMLISGGGDGTIKLWKLSSNPDEGIQELARLGEDDAESVLSLTVDGSFLYSGKLEGVIELWDLDTKQRLRVIKAQKGDIMTLQMGWGFLWSAGATGYARVNCCFPGTCDLRILITINRNIPLCSTANIGMLRIISVRNINASGGGRAMKAGYLPPLLPPMMASSSILPAEMTIPSPSGILAIAILRRTVLVSFRRTCL